MTPKETKVRERVAESGAEPNLLGSRTPTLDSGSKRNGMFLQPDGHRSPVHLCVKTLHYHSSRSCDSSTQLTVFEHPMLA